MGVVIKTNHHCMSKRGVHEHDTDMITGRMLEAFRDDATTRRELFAMAD
jgi:GTP cyclohydrolase I